MREVGGAPRTDAFQVLQRASRGTPPEAGTRADGSADPGARPVLLAGAHQQFDLPLLHHLLEDAEARLLPQREHLVEAGLRLLDLDRRPGLQIVEGLQPLLDARLVEGLRLAAASAGATPGQSVAAPCRPGGGRPAATFTRPRNCGYCSSSRLRSSCACMSTYASNRRCSSAGDTPRRAAARLRRAAAWAAGGAAHTARAGRALQCADVCTGHSVPL